MNDPVQPQSAVVEQQEQRVELLPTEPDWDLWYRAHPSICQHVKTMHGHCDRCGTCIDHPACAVMRDLASRRDNPELHPPVGLIMFYRQYVNPIVAQLLFLFR